MPLGAVHHQADAVTPRDDLFERRTTLRRDHRETPWQIDRERHLMPDNTG